MCTSDPARPSIRAVAARRAMRIVTSPCNPLREE